MAFYCFVPQNDLNDVCSGNLNSQKDLKDQVFLRNNILHFVLECTKFYMYVKTQMTAFALLSPFSTRRICSRDAKRKQEFSNVIGCRSSELFRQPITLLNSCFRFASREQIRLVENGLNSGRVNIYLNVPVWTKNHMWGFRVALLIIIFLTCFCRYFLEIVTERLL